MNEVYVVSAVRTAIGTFGGSLKDIPPTELASRRDRRSGARASRRAGRNRPCGVRSGGADRTATARCGRRRQRRHCRPNTRADGEPPMRLRPPGDRVGSAKHHAGRLRCRCRRRRGKHEPRAVQRAVIPVGRPDGRRLSSTCWTGALNDPFHECCMGVTAENVAERLQITRDDQDALALENAIAALSNGQQRRAISRTRSSASR